MFRPRSVVSRLSAASAQRRGARDSDDEEEEALVKRVELALLVTRIVIVCSMLAVALYFVVSDLIKYYKRDTITAISVDLLPNVTFPAVTLCNYNRWKSSLVSTDELSSLAQQMQAEQWMNVAPDYADMYGDYGTTDMAATSESFENITSTTSSASSTEAQVSTTVRPDSGFNLYNFTLSSGWKLTESAADNSSGNVQGTLLSCTFRGVKCGLKFFTKTMTSYGNCYTFNKDINWTSLSTNTKRRLTSPLVQIVPHEDTGLSLEVDVEAWDYFENVGINGNYPLGLKVIVHSPDRLPEPSSEGISISPGYHAAIPVTWSEYNYMEPPYGSCNASAKLQYFGTYTQEGCMWECIKTKVLSACSCVIYYQATSSDIVCNLNKSKECAYKLIADVENNPDTYCTCPVACTQEVYDSSAYYATSPSPLMEAGLATKYGMTASYYSSNVVSMDIYVSQMARTTVKQVAAMTIDQVFANAGGQLGLFAGASFVTLVELAEFAFERWVERRSERTKRIKVRPADFK